MKPSYGVIVGRFQVPDLHDGHMELFRQVRARHNGVLVFVGCHPAGMTKDHPLDFPTRKAMIQAKFPEFTVLPLMDTRDDASWSNQLDASISSAISGPADVTLYGGRDSFVPHYLGAHKPVELALPVETQKISGTMLREQFSNTVIESAGFRAGMIYAAAHLWPVVLACVDIAIFTTDYKQVLLGRKTNDPVGKYRLVGGHAEKSTPTYEADAKKEVYEETTLDTHNMEYIGSAIIPDWRYNTSDRAVKTSFFATTVTSQGAVAKDDLAGGEVRWFKTDRLEASDIVDTHQPLFTLLQAFLTKKGVVKEEAHHGSVQHAATV